MNDTELIRQIELNYGNTAGLVVRKQGDVVYEKYFDGHGSMDHSHVFSVTKSITSLMIGIAIDQGYLESVNQKVLEFFPDYQVKRGEHTIQQVTLRNLLTMTAPYKYKSEPYTKVYGSEDWVKAGLDLLGGKKEIGEFLYSTVGTQILTGVLEHAVGKPLVEFAGECLFQPLGIDTPPPITFAGKEEHLAFYRRKQMEGWVVDPKSQPAAGWGLCLKTGDMAKIGQLMLNRGMWEGRRLVSESWIQESTREQVRWGMLPYGYLWWILPESGGENCFAAMGDGGNIIYVNPGKQIAAAIACYFKPRAANRVELIEQYVLPMIS